jgi:hypothetical protein
MTLEEVAEDIFAYAMMNGGGISFWKYVKFTSYTLDQTKVPSDAEQIIEAMIWLQEQGHGTFWRDEVGEVDGVYVGEGHADRARAHRERALRQWLTQQPSNVDDLAQNSGTETLMDDDNDNVLF